MPKIWNKEHALELREQGHSYTRIGQFYCISMTTARRWMDPEYDAYSRRKKAESDKRRRAKIRAYNRDKREYVKTQREQDRQALARKAAAGLQNISGRPAEDDWNRLRKLIPDDVRSMTARLMGDPIPGDERRARS